MALNAKPASKNETSSPNLEGVAAPYVARLFNRHGPVNRRKILQVASGGIVGIILGGSSVKAESFFSRLLGAWDASAAVAAEGTPQLAGLGDYLWLTPTKLGGGVQVQDLQNNKTLAWIEYWNYGDSCPIAHHLAAFPSSDPRSGFEFVNSTQGGQNVLIYGIPTRIREHGMLDPLWGQGNQIYRVGFDGTQMNLLENVAETTGIRPRRSHGHFPRCFGLFGLGWTKRYHCVFHARYRAFAEDKGLSGLSLRLVRKRNERRSRGQLVQGRQSPDHQTRDGA